MSVADEIQAIADNADKCINYPIGEKIEAFMRQQDESKQTNFILSGVLIFAAARIYGRKVDYLEQEIIGISKNFQAVDTAEEKQPEKELKKTRTKKFLIKDRVNLEKTTFKETPIQVLATIDINKTLVMPSRIDRLQRMKEFFSKNKSRTGKLVIPKTLLFTNDYVVSNFGSTQIYDFDDNKDIVGSRRDFTSFSYFINSYTGELQNDIILSSSDEFHRESDPSPQRSTSPVDWATPTTPARCDSPEGQFELLRRSDTPRQLDFTGSSTSGALSPFRAATPDITLDASDTGIQDSTNSVLESTNTSVEPSIHQESPEISLISPEKEKDLDDSINIDEGIEIDQAENLLLPLTPEKILESAPKFFPSDLPPDTLLNLYHSMDEPQNTSDTCSVRMEPEVQIRNMFLIPLKKLKRKCIFELPNDEYGDLKRKKRDQWKPQGLEMTIQQMRMFKHYGMFSPVLDSEDEPFLGFTMAQQNISTTIRTLPSSNKSLKSPHVEASRKISNDSGVSTTADIDLNETDETSRILDVTATPSINDPSIDLPNEGNEDPSNINISGGDSCYQSLASGDSARADLSSFFKDFESRNNTIEINETPNDSVETGEVLKESEERVLQMQQSAMNIAKWKEYLKPILAGSEARSKIDMHQYGLQLINKIGNVNDSATLAEITEPGKTPAYFLTMLQLINNRNVEISFGERTMQKPVDINNINIKLKSKTLHREKFDEMGQQFSLEEEKKVSLKRKIVQTSTPAKAVKRDKSGPSRDSFSNSFNGSQSMIGDDSEQNNLILSQASSGYCSQNSITSEC